MFVPVFLLFSWWFFCLLERGKSRGEGLLRKALSLNYSYFMPVFCLGLLAMHLHLLTVNMAVIAFLYVALSAFYAWYKGEGMSVYTVYLLAGSVLFLAFLTLFGSTSQFISRETLSFVTHWGYVSHILAHFEHTLIGALLILVGSFYCLHFLPNKKAGLWIFLNFFGIVLAAIFLWKRNVGVQYIAFAQPFVLIIAAAGIYGVLTYAK